MVDEQHVKFMKMYVCDVAGCGKQFKRRDRLLIHSRTHTGERPFKCTIDGCGKSYCRQTHLQRHQQNSHTPQPPEEERKYFFCEEEGCCSVFTMRDNLKKHLRLQHSVEAKRPYKCDVEGCEEAFRKHQQLRTHRFREHHIDPYVCSYPGCRRVYQTPSHLRRHLKIHEGYICKVDGCNVVFNKWTELRQHKSKMHAKEHKCPFCDKVFPKRCLMNDHVRIHHKKMPLTCPHEDCSCVYWQKRNLKTHINNNHDSRRFPCSVCEKTFASKQGAWRHAAVHNPDGVIKKGTAPRTKRGGRKKMSTATRLTGIQDIELMDVLDPVTLVSDGPNLTVSSPHRQQLQAKRAQESGQCLLTQHSAQGKSTQGSAYVELKDVQTTSRVSEGEQVDVVPETPGHGEHPQEKSMPETSLEDWAVSKVGHTTMSTQQEEKERDIENEGGIARVELEVGKGMCIDEESIQGKEILAEVAQQSDGGKKTPAFEKCRDTQQEGLDSGFMQDVLGTEVEMSALRDLAVS